MVNPISGEENPVNPFRPQELERTRPLLPHTPTGEPPKAISTAPITAARRVEFRLPDSAPSEKQRPVAPSTLPRTSMQSASFAPEAVASLASLLGRLRDTAETNPTDESEVFTPRRHIPPRAVSPDAPRGQSLDVRI